MPGKLYGDLQKALKLVAETNLSNFQIDAMTGVSHSRVMMLRKELKQKNMA